MTQTTNVTTSNDTNPVSIVISLQTTTILHHVSTTQVSAIQETPPHNQSAPQTTNSSNQDAVNPS
ncbi:hypothetical protein, partial [Staphylococcus aureus]